jgi:hypothetical protein
METATTPLHMRSHHPTQDATYRDTTDPKKVPNLRTQAAMVAAPPLALWALAHPATTLLALAALAALAWHRHVAGPPKRLGSRPASPPD